LKIKGLSKKYRTENPRVDGSIPPLATTSKVFLSGVSIGNMCHIRELWFDCLWKGYKKPHPHVLALPRNLKKRTDFFGPGNIQILGTR